MKNGELKIETEGLVIRPYVITYYGNWYRQYNERLPSQSKYDDGRPSDMCKLTRDWFEAWVQSVNKRANKDECYHFGIFRKADGVNVGKVEVYTILRLDYQWAMMGYSIHNQFWRNGYAYESVTVATQAFFARLGYHRIELHINVDNEPSLSLAKKAGFQFECTRENFSYEDGKWTDFHIYYLNDNS